MNSEITPRDYQNQAANFLSSKRRAGVEAAAGSGKTIIAALALDNAIRAKPRNIPFRIGWVAPTIETREQARKAIALFPWVAAQDVRIECAAADTDWSDRQVLVVDEAHTSTAPQLRAQIERCPGAWWALTATPTGDDHERNAALREMFPVWHTVTREEVGQALAPAVVTWLYDTDQNLAEPIDAEIDRIVRYRGRWWKGDPQALWGQVAWQICNQIGIVNNTARNRSAIIAASSPRQTLVLVGSIEHGKSLAASIPSCRPVWSGMGAKLRREAMADFLAGKLRCIVSTSLADVGLDLPNCEVVVMVAGGKNSTRTEQRTGRALRIHAGKTEGLIVDWKDQWHPLPAKHARRRGELYTQLGYKQKLLDAVML